MKWILIAAEIYAGGCGLLILLNICIYIWRYNKMFDTDVVWIAFLWPILTLAPIFWIGDYIAELNESKRLALRQNKFKYNELEKNQY
jgi:hypothetical protein